MGWVRSGWRWGGGGSECGWRWVREEEIRKGDLRALFISRRMRKLMVRNYCLILFENWIWLWIANWVCKGVWPWKHPTHQPTPLLTLIITQAQWLWQFSQRSFYFVSKGFLLCCRLDEVWWWPQWVSDVCVLHWCKPICIVAQEALSL